MNLANVVRKTHLEVAAAL